MANDIAECAEKLESRLTNLVLSSDAGGLTVNIVEYMSMCTYVILFNSVSVGGKWVSVAWN